MTRAALYLRVSTEDQTEENQAPELRQLAERRGWEAVEYRETGSAAKVRPVLDRLMTDARAGRLGAVVVWALDRLDRSHIGCMLRVAELDRIGVLVVSLRDPWLDTSGPARSLLVSIFGWVAEHERTRLIERTVAGHAQVRREEATEAGRARRRAAGKQAIGRPRTSPVLLHAAADLVRHGGGDGKGFYSIRAAARAKGVPEATLRRFLASLPPETPPPSG